MSQSEGPASSATPMAATLSRRSFLRDSGAVLVGTGLLGGFTGCLGQDSETRTGTSASGTARRGGAVRMALRGSPNDSLDPIRQQIAFEIIAVRSIYDGLIDLDGEFKPTPKLATAWESSKDLRTWTFELEQGVEFHDGSPFTARDVEHTLRRNVDPKGGSPVHSTFAPLLKPSGIKRLDDHTLRLHLEMPYVFLPQALGSRYLCVLKDGQTSFERPVGTGPFVYTSFAPGRSFEAARNTGYWREGRPYLEKLELTAVNDASSRVESLLTKQVDIVDAVDYSLVPTIRDTSSHEIIELKGARWPTIVTRLDTEPFTDRRIVEALKYAVDREQLLGTVYNGAGTVAADSPIGSADAAATKRDVDRARALLREAGHAGGVDLEVIASPIAPSLVNMVSAVKEQVAEAGIRLGIRQWPEATFWDEVWLKKPMYATLWVSRPPDEILSIAFTSGGQWNETALRSRRLDALVAEARRTADTAKQEKLYQEAQTIIAREDGHVIPVFLDALSAKSKQLQDVALNHQWNTGFADAWMA